MLQPPCPSTPLYPPAPDPGGSTTANLPVPPRNGKLFGFNTNEWWEAANGADPTAFVVANTARAGAQVLRTTVTWSTLATSPDRPLGPGSSYPRGEIPAPVSLARLDEIYDRATAAGLRLDLIINNAPQWASAYANCTPFLGMYPARCSPVANHARLYPTADHLQDLSNFVTALGNRYPGVTFETWNEPNLDRGPQAVSGAFMGQMQCAVWRAAKALPNPSFVLSPAFGAFYGEAATRQYMRDFYSTGGGCFDALSVHTYNGSALNFGANSPLAGHMKIYRDARAEAGDTRPMWVTEFGFSTARSRHAVSLSEQASLSWQEYNKLLSMPDVATALVHTLRDTQGSSTNINTGYGWLWGSGSAKPVYCWFTKRAGRPAC